MVLDTLWWRKLVYFTIQIKCMFDKSSNLKPDLQNQKPDSISISLGLVSVLFWFDFESETKKKEQYRQCSKRNSNPPSLLQTCFIFQWIHLEYETRIRIESGQIKLMVLIYQYHIDIIDMHWHITISIRLLHNAIFSIFLW